jgi:hypothetical protein
MALFRHRFSRLTLKGIITDRNKKALVQREIYEPNKEKELKTTRVNNLFHKVFLDIAASLK